MHKGLALAALALGILAGSPSDAAEGPTLAPPAARDFRLGAIEITSLRDGGWIIPNDGSVYVASPAEASRLLVAAGAPPDPITLGVDVLLVRLPGHKVLLDAGLGPPDHGALPGSLALAHVTAAQITDVLVTHSHLDHVGGLLDEAGHSAFPKAVIWLSAKEWEAMRRSGETKALAAVIAPQVRTFEPGEPILSGVTPIALYGHTPGHVGYQIVSRGRQLTDIGDTAHSAILGLAEPGWTDAYDSDPAAGIATRRAELTRLAANGELVFAPHFPFPGLGRIEAVGDHFRWRPLASRELQSP